MFVLDPGWVNSRVIDLASRTNGARRLSKVAKPLSRAPGVVRVNASTNFFATTEPVAYGGPKTDKGRAARETGFVARSADPVFPKRSELFGGLALVNQARRRLGLRLQFLARYAKLY
jgi:hypothetical protein